MLLKIIFLKNIEIDLIGDMFIKSVLIKESDLHLFVFNRIHTY